MKRRVLLSVEDAAEHVGISAEQLRLHHEGGTGPSYVKVSPKIIRYLAEDLDEWDSDNRQCDD